MDHNKRPFETRGAEAARNDFPSLISAASEGRTTIITRHGRPVAAIVPAESVLNSQRQLPISTIAGTGKGLWGKNSRRTIAKLRDEWNR